jgi:hypothetical protein
MAKRNILKLQNTQNCLDDITISHKSSGKALISKFVKSYKIIIFTNMLCKPLLPFSPEPSVFPPVVKKSKNDNI